MVIVVVKPRPAAGSDKIDVDWAVVDVDWPVARTDWPIGPVDDYVVVVADVDRRPPATDIDGRSIPAANARTIRETGAIGPVPATPDDGWPITAADIRTIRETGAIGGSKTAFWLAGP